MRSVAYLDDFFFSNPLGEPRRPDHVPIKLEFEWSAFNAQVRICQIHLIFLTATLPHMDLDEQELAAQKAKERIPRYTEACEADDADGILESTTDICKIFIHLRSQELPIDADATNDDANCFSHATEAVGIRGREARLAWARTAASVHAPIGATDVKLTRLRKLGLAFSALERKLAVVRKAGRLDNIHNPSFKTDFHAS